MPSLFFLTPPRIGKPPMIGVPSLDSGFFQGVGCFLLWDYSFFPRDSTPPLLVGLSEMDGLSERLSTQSPYSFSERLTFVSPSNLYLRGRKKSLLWGFFRLAEFPFPPVLSLDCFNHGDWVRSHPWSSVF